MKNLFAISIALITLLLSSSANADSFETTRNIVKNQLIAEGHSANALNPNTHKAAQFRNYLKNTCLYSKKSTYDKFASQTSYFKMALHSNGQAVFESGLLIMVNGIAQSSPGSTQTLYGTWETFSNLDGLDVAFLSLSNGTLTPLPVYIKEAGAISFGNRNQKKVYQRLNINQC